MPSHIALDFPCNLHNINQIGNYIHRPTQSCLKNPKQYNFGHQRLPYKIKLQSLVNTLNLSIARKEKKLVMKLITTAHAMFTIMLNLAFVAC
jgi:hypothetical protein